MRQISAAIDEAVWTERFNDRQLVAWQTRMICSWLVKLTPDMSEEAAKQLLEEAQGISLDGMNPSVEGNNTQKKSSPVSAKPTKNDFYKMSEQDIENSLGQADNGDGSFEALMGSLGLRFSRPI